MAESACVPVHAAAKFVVARIRAGDELGRKEAAGPEQGLADAEIGLEERIPDGLQHLDGGDPIEAAAQRGELSVVEQQDLGLVGDAFPFESGLGKLLLFDAEGHGGDTAAIIADGVTREAAPARSDLQHLMPGLEAELTAKAVVLRDLGGFEGLVRRLKQGRRIGHRGIEPQLVEPVPEVVVCVDVMP